jgi:hypothetical protein
MRLLLVAALASCGSPRSTPSPESVPPPPPADARIAASDAGPSDAPTPATSDAGAAPSPRPRGTTLLDTWRSRAELPTSVAARIPADVDFDHEMLAASLPATLEKIELRAPAKPPTRDGAWLVIEEQARSQCRVCTGVQQPLPPRRPMPPTVIWRIPREADVTTVLRLRPARPCPPCLAP